MIQVKQKFSAWKVHGTLLTEFFALQSQNGHSVSPKDGPFNQINLNIMITKIGNMATKISFYRGSDYGSN